MKLGLILNPYSRYNKKHPESIIKYCDIGGSRVDLFRTESPDDVTEVIRQIRNEDVSFIGISGGDGTIHQVLSRVIQVYGEAPIPPVILLGDGTMNNIAHSLGMKSKGTAVLKRFLSTMEDEKLTIKERCTMKIGERHCFLFGCGITTNFLNEVYKGRKGYLRNIKVLHRTFSDILLSSLFRRKESSLLQPLEAEIFCDGMNLDLSRLRIVLAGTVEEVGMGFRPLYKANERDHHFHLIATDLNPPDVLLRMGILGTGMGNIMRNPHFCNRLAREITISAKNPFFYTMDGDMYRSEGDLKVESGASIRFVIV